jgi:hypothetical protein
MGFMENLLKTETRIRQQIEGLFGKGASQTPLEVRREILDQVEARIFVDKGGKSFAFGRVIIHLHVHTAALRDVFQAAFLRDRSLENDIRELLTESGARFPQSLEVRIELEEPGSPVPEAGAGAPFSLDFVRMEDVRGQVRKQATLVVARGTAERDAYTVAKDRVLIGRLGELLDREGQMARKNDIVFLDNGDEINSTIGRAHATIFFDHARSEYRITDDVSRYGTRIFREGRSIEVPSGNSRGIRLRSGDEIYVGRGCLRFEIADEKE